MTRKLAILVPALLLLAGTTPVIWCGLALPAPASLLAPGDVREEPVFRSSGENILWSDTEGSVLWSRAVGPPGSRPPRAVREVLADGSGIAEVWVGLGTVPGRLCRPLGLDWGEPAEMCVGFTVR